MWLSGVLVSILALAKPSVADLGLPLSIIGLQNNIRSLIDSATKFAKPFNETLRDLDGLPWTNLGYAYQHARQEWQASMADLSWIQNYTLTNLTKAIDDQSSGHRKVLDDLYGNIEKLKEQVAEDQWLADSYYELKGGLKFIQQLNNSRKLLESGLNGLRDAFKALDEVISKAQLVKPLTRDNIGKVIAPGMTLAVWTATSKVLSSMGSLENLASDLILASKLASQDADEFKIKLEKMVDWKDLKTVSNATDIAAMKFQSMITTPIKKLNQTIWSGYKPLSKSKLIQDGSSIDVFVKNFNEALLDLNSSVTDEAQSIFGYVETLISWLKFNFDQQIGTILDKAEEKIFTNGNSSLEENCAQKYPLINATVASAIKYMGSCTWEQIKYLPDLAKTFEEFLQPISLAAMAPLDNLQKCNSSKLDRNLCRKTFVTTHMLQVNGTTTSDRTLATTAVINRLMKPVNRVMLKEFAKLYTQLDSCFNGTTTEHILEELLRNRLACYDRTDL